MINLLDTYYIPNYVTTLTHSFPMHPFSTPYGFLIFLGGKERVLWERMG